MVAGNCAQDLWKRSTELLTTEPSLQSTNTLSKREVSAGEMTQCLKALDIHAKDPGSAPSAHVVAYNLL